MPLREDLDASGRRVLRDRSQLPGLLLLVPAIPALRDVRSAHGGENRRASAYRRPMRDVGAAVVPLPDLGGMVRWKPEPRE